MSLLGSGPVALMCIEVVGLDNLLGSLSFWGHTETPVTHGK